MCPLFLCATGAEDCENNPVTHRPASFFESLAAKKSGEHRGGRGHVGSGMDRNRSVLAVCSTAKWKSFFGGAGRCWFTGHQVATDMFPRRCKVSRKKGKTEGRRGYEMFRDGPILETPPFPTRRKSPPYENNQTLTKRPANPHGCWVLGCFEFV